MFKHESKVTPGSKNESATGGATLKRTIKGVISINLEAEDEAVSETGKTFWRSLNMYLACKNYRIW